jgi:hypothetical protein
MQLQINNKDGYQFTLNVAPRTTTISWFTKDGDNKDISSSIDLDMDRVEQQSLITALSKCTSMQHDEYVQMKFGKHTIRISSPSAQDTPDLQIVILWVRDAWISLEPSGLETAVLITALKETLPSK